MLFFSLWPDGGGSIRMRPALTRCAANRRARGSAGCGRAGLRGPSESPPASTASWARGRCGSTPGTPEKRLSRRLDYVAIEGRKPNSFREGVLFSPGANADAFLVTLHKSEADYSPTTMYQDYAISPELFHWESQSAQPWPPRRVSATSTTAPAGATSSSSLGSRRSPLSARARRTSSSARRTTWNTEESGRSRSPGDFGRPMPAADFAGGQRDWLLLQSRCSQ